MPRFADPLTPGLPAHGGSKRNHGAVVGAKAELGVMQAHGPPLTSLAQLSTQL